MNAHEEIINLLTDVADKKSFIAGLQHAGKLCEELIKLKEKGYDYDLSDMSLDIRAIISRIRSVIRKMEREK